MKILKSIVSLLVILSGVAMSYLAFMSFESQSWTKTGIFIAASLVLLCLGIVTLLLTVSNKKMDVDAGSNSLGTERISHDEGKDAVMFPFRENDSDEITKTNEVADLVDILPGVFESLADMEFGEAVFDVVEPRNHDAMIESAYEHAIEELEVTNAKELGKVVDEETEMTVVISEDDQIGFKEDPKFLFGDWWVDEGGLYIDMRLIGIAGRKQQKALRKLAPNTELHYHINTKNKSIDVLHDKVVLGRMPDLYARSILVYIQGVDCIKAESMVKKGRDVVQFMVKVRFSEELREKLQKRLQQRTWQ